MNHQPRNLTLETGFVGHGLGYAVKGAGGVVFGIEDRSGGPASDPVPQGNAAALSCTDASDTTFSVMMKRQAKRGTTPAST